MQDKILAKGETIFLTYFLLGDIQDQTMLPNNINYL